MKRIRLLICLIVLAPLTSRAESLSAVEGRYRVDPSSTIRFSVAQLGGQAIEGTFTQFSGSFRLAGAEASASSVAFTLAPSSVRAADPRIEDFIKSDTVFAVETYPQASFRSTSVKRTGEDTAVINGRLTAKGVTRDSRFDIRFLGRTGSAFKFHVTGKMSRALFHMDVGTPIYSNMVVLDMELIGRPE
jgi:polyisoprenoid-binding protein YceI